MSEKKERFGRYLILDHLVDGGMAKICRARFLGEQADKIVAIKMVQPQYSKDDSFKQMFMNEIKVTFGLLHPNIVQTYDYGFHKDQLFVAMEYCDGRNLKEYLDRLRQKKFVFPVEICVYIISQVCQGLNYAHSYTDKLTGKAAHIIHRDISPHNVMLTYDGAVKVIDFGIAKANTNSEATQAGTIKGKLSYLAPEYLDGKELDHRYDQFAVGITLWEMLCSRKLFKAPNDLAVLKKIQECKVPAPSSINPNVPKELDEIVLRSLSKDREDRFENMDQMNRALIKFLYAHYPDFNSSDLSYFAKELFKEEIKKDREKLFEYGKINIKPYIEDMNKESQTGTAPSESIDEKSPRKVEQVLDFGFGGDKSPPSPIIANRQRAVNTFKDSTSKNVNSQNFAQSGKRKRGGVSKAYTKATDVSDVEFEDNKSSVKSFLKVCCLSLAALGGVWFWGGDQIDKTLTSMIPVVTEKIQMFIGKKIDSSNHLNEEEIAKAEEIATQPIAPSKKQNIKIRLENFDKYRQKVFVNNDQVKPDLFNSFEVHPNKSDDTFFIRVEEPGLKHFISQVEISENESSYVVEVPKMEPMSFGYLYMSGCRIYGKIVFTLWGETRQESVPITSSLGIAFPVEGQDSSRGLASDEALKIKFYSSNSKLQNNGEVLDLHFEKEGQRINLCDILNL